MDDLALPLMGLIIMLLDSALCAYMVPKRGRVIPVASDVGA